MTYPTTAFPTMHYHQEDLGMSLRDYFAAKALQGMLADTCLKATPIEFAYKSYELADAMLCERKKSPPSLTPPWDIT